VLSDREKRDRKLYYERHRDEILKKQEEKYQKNKDDINKQRREKYKNNEEYRKKISEEKKAYRLKNKYKLKEKAQEFYQKNKDILREKNKAYRLKNKDKLKEKAQEYYQKNKSQINKKCKNYQIKNKDRYKNQQKEKNKEKKFKKILKDFHNETTGEKEFWNIYKKNCVQENYNRWLEKDNINYKIAHCLRNRVRCALYNNGTNKSVSTINLLGCNIKQLKKYLEKQFKTGMSWDNHSKWHIDHIKPCASFDLREKKEQLKCFHFTNLQPLWALENRQKSDKIL